METSPHEWSDPVFVFLGAETTWPGAPLNRVSKRRAGPSPPPAILPGVTGAAALGK